MTPSHRLGKRGSTTATMRGHWIDAKSPAGVFLMPFGLSPSSSKRGRRVYRRSVGASQPREAPPRLVLVRVLLRRGFRPYTRTTSNELDEENEPWPCEKWTALSFGTSRSTVFSTIADAFPAAFIDFYISIYVAIGLPQTGCFYRGRERAFVPLGRRSGDGDGAPARREVGSSSPSLNKGEDDDDRRQDHLQSRRQ